MLGVLMLTFALGAPATQASPPPRAPRRPAPAVGLERAEADELLARVEEYLDHRREAREELPKLKDKAEPEDVTAYAKTLSDNIRARRRGAKQGDVFTPKVARGLRRLFARGLAATTRDREVVLTEGNPTGDEERLQAPSVVVNGQYIPAAPLSTIPPTLLLALPTLPEQVEYRFVGRSLILRDAVANLIIDFLPEAVP
jgi:hypothetical protein